MAQMEKVIVPDLGGAKSVSVLELLAKPGDTVAVDASLLTVEGEKATMDLPTPVAGKLVRFLVEPGAKVSEGDVVAEVAVEGSVVSAAPMKADAKPAAPEVKPVTEAPVSYVAAKTEQSTETVLAGPAVRRLSRELDVALTEIAGTGANGRITLEDVQQYVKRGLAGGGGGGLPFALPPKPDVDFARFGEVETQPLSKIKKISGANLHRNWVSIPHITQFGYADITELEAFRVAEKEAAQKRGVRLTPLIFIMKAVVHALKQHPTFNASLDASGDHLVLKKYFHIGVAVDTPNGLVVPVIRDVDRKGMDELARELSTVSEKARTKGLSLAEMQGGCFSISSLGGIGGTAFTPIINAPEVAILGVSQTETKPVYQNGAFVPRQMLPLSLSYDHRVIDGAEGARFLVTLSQALADLRRVLF